jgi:ubiquinone/menaquinone biosynthesis C-methylase UbiE
MNREYAESLLRKTKEDYNLISDQFSSTRYSVWPELSSLGEYIKEGDKILDLGCGNGRMLEFLKGKNVDYIGVDNSEKLINIARDKHPSINFQVADALNLTFPDNSFDKIISIAVLHHIPSDDFREKFIKEAKRVLKPGGLLIITVWDLWHKITSFKRIIRFYLLKILGKTKLDFNDVLVPWQKTVDRYIHCFTKSELYKLVKNLGFEIINFGTFKRKETKNYNIFLIAKK